MLPFSSAVTVWSPIVTVAFAGIVVAALPSVSLVVTVTGVGPF